VWYARLAGSGNPVIKWGIYYETKTLYDTTT
jgi:hypothetical protein